MTTKTKIILILIAVFLGLIFFGLYQYKNRIKAEIALAEARESIVLQQKYIEEKTEAIKQLEKKYKEKLMYKPSDICGDSQVSKDIIDWLNK